MSNEETIIMQPKNNEKKAEESQNTVANKDEKKKSNGKRVAAVTGAAIGGAAIGGAGGATAATMMGTASDSEEDVAVQPEEDVAATPQHTQSQPEPAPVEDDKDDVVVTPVGEEGPDYTNNDNANPVATPEPAVQETSATQDDGSDDVQILGVYERTTEDGVHQEAAVLTDGEDVAVILDADGDNIADVLISDDNHNQQIDEGEVYDISEYHVQMDTVEEQYVAQQQMEQEQQDTFAYEASDDQDYDNNADVDNFA